MQPTKCQCKTCQAEFMAGSKPRCPGCGDRSTPDPVIALGCQPPHKPPGRSRPRWDDKPRMIEDGSLAMPERPDRRGQWVVAPGTAVLLVWWDDRIEDYVTEQEMRFPYGIEKGATVEFPHDGYKVVAEQDSIDFVEN